MIFRKLDTEPGPKARITDSSPQSTSGPAAAGLFRRGPRRIGRSPLRAPNLEDDAVQGDAQERGRGEDEGEAHRGAVEDGHGLGEHFVVSDVLLHCSALRFEAPCSDAFIDMAASNFDQMNIE
jgi:hypothetical protein